MQAQTSRETLISQLLAHELSVDISQITAAVRLLDEGDTVPFIARYRKEVTGGLTDDHLRLLAERLVYLRELEERRAAIIASIEEQGKLLPALLKDLQEADSKARLEDLYLPYKPKRRSKAQIAKEAGLEPLSQFLLQDPNLDPQLKAQEFLNPEHKIDDAAQALEGARFILMEQFAEDAHTLGRIREYLWQKSLLQSTVITGQEEKGQKFRDYFNHSESFNRIPSHRTLAMLRGRKEGLLQLTLILETENTHTERSYPESVIAERWQVANQNRASDAWLLETVRWTWRIKLQPHFETELLSQLRENAEEQAIAVFASNLRDLLMSSPAGPRTIMGLDPGLRSGVKLAVIDKTGKLLHHATIYPHVPQNQWAASLNLLSTVVKEYSVDLIAIGNGTASRETAKLITDLLQKEPALNLTPVSVSEAGASVYSASELAALEFPDIDVSIRGAVSIARRLQDPLAELVKIEPKAIGVGQYQHDVNQSLLSRSLGDVVEDCVNAVGVDVNTASVPLLARVAGLNQGIASQIVTYRDTNGPFKTRDHLKLVPRLGPKAFEQSAGFLRIMDGDNPLDASTVHPEAYAVVHRILEKTKKPLQALIGDKTTLQSLQAAEYTDSHFGLPTVQDILKELEKPGRDPRPAFKTAQFKAGVETLKDLQPAMVLEGVVTNVADFGVFVDIGVHQDGLVHISCLAEKFVKNPRDVVKTGDIVTVKVLEVDIHRKRISLTMRLNDNATGSSQASQNSAPQQPKKVPKPPIERKPTTSVFGASLEAAFKDILK